MLNQLVRKICFAAFSFVLGVFIKRLLKAHLFEGLHDLWGRSLSDSLLFSADYIFSYVKKNLSVAIFNIWYRLIARARPCWIIVVVKWAATHPGRPRGGWDGVCTCERCKLPQRGPRQSPAAEWFSCILCRQIAFPSISVRVAYSLHG